ncbi:MAG: glycosyl hydrolase family 18 protein [Syntrophomonadaceae bacterium]|nr:glycosyl hydrolase family 18 protein [Syntrophomonadaceae bacterium]
MPGTPYQPSYKRTLRLSAAAVLCLCVALYLWPVAVWAGLLAGEGGGRGDAAALTAAGEREETGGAAVETGEGGMDGPAAAGTEAGDDGSNLPQTASRGLERPRDGLPLVLGFYNEDYPGDGSSLESLRRHRQFLAGVAPFWYSIDQQGKVNYRGGERAEAIILAREAGMAVLGLFNNRGGTDRFLQDPWLRSVAVRGVLETVEAEGLDGVNIDFELLEPSSRQGLCEFMAELYPLLERRGKVVTISVSPKWLEDEHAQEWAFAYDYARLAGLADYLVIMTYDQHGAWSGPGPVAARDWVERCVNFALGRVPADKILLGVAGYGYDWGGGSVRVVRAGEADELARSVGAEVVRDRASGEQTFSYRWQGSEHRVWWEDAASAREKVMLARRRGLAGIALWRLGQEEEGLWAAVCN